MILTNMSYELMIAAKTDGAEAFFTKAEKFIKDAEATDLKTEKLGRKRLAYPIKKQTEAEFFVLNFEAQSGSVGKITAKLRLEQDDLLRYLLLKTKPLKIKKATPKVLVEEVKKEEKPKVTVITKVAPKAKKTKTVNSKKKVSSKVKAKGKK